MKFLFLSLFTVINFGCDSGENASSPTRKDSGTVQQNPATSVPVNQGNGDALTNSGSTSGGTSTVQNPYEKAETKEVAVEKTEVEKTEQNKVEEEKTEEVVKLNLIEIYEFYSANDRDHDYSNDTQRNDLGFFRVIEDSTVAGVKPIYRCFSAQGSNHFVSTDESCEGPSYQNQGKYGYIYGEEGKGTPLWRCYKLDIFDHALSDKQGNCPDGYERGGILGYYPDVLQ